MNTPYLFLYAAQHFRYRYSSRKSRLRRALLSRHINHKNKTLTRGLLLNPIRSHGIQILRGAQPNHPTSTKPKLFHRNVYEKSILLRRLHKEFSSIPSTVQSIIPSIGIKVLFLFCTALRIDHYCAIIAKNVYSHIVQT